MYCAPVQVVRPQSTHHKRRYPPREGANRHRCGPPHDEMDRREQRVGETAVQRAKQPHLSREQRQQEQAKGNNHDQPSPAGHTTVEASADGTIQSRAATRLGSYEGQRACSGGSCRRDAYSRDGCGLGGPADCRIVDHKWLLRGFHREHGREGQYYGQQDEQNRAPRLVFYHEPPVAVRPPPVVGHRGLLQRHRGCVLGNRRRRGWRASRRLSRFGTGPLHQSRPVGAPLGQYRHGNRRVLAYGLQLRSRINPCADVRLQPSLRLGLFVGRPVAPQRLLPHVRSTETRGSPSTGQLRLPHRRGLRGIGHSVREAFACGSSPLKGTQSPTVVRQWSDVNTARERVAQISADPRSPLPP